MHTHSLAQRSQLGRCTGQVSHCTAQSSPPAYSSSSLHKGSLQCPLSEPDAQAGWRLRKSLVHSALLPPAAPFLYCQSILPKGLSHTWYSLCQIGQSS